MFRSLRSKEEVRNEARSDYWQDTNSKRWHPPVITTRTPRLSDRTRSNELVILGKDSLVRTQRVTPTRRCKAKYNSELQEIFNREGEDKLAKIGRTWYLGFIRR